MRLLAEIPQLRAAQAFVDFLRSHNITAEVRKNNTAARVQIWVTDGEPHQRALMHWQHFVSNPQDPRYRAASWVNGETGMVIRAPPTVSAAAAGIAGGYWAGFLARAGWLTRSVMLLVLLVAWMTQLGRNPSFSALLISTYNDALVEVIRGEYYRLLTPVLLHFSTLHLLFNLMWFWDLGGAIEKRLGAMALLALMITIALVSNLAQFYVSGPLFGGLSGIIYGFFGFLFVLGRRAPWMGLHISNAVMGVLIIWQLLCFTGLVGNVANTAHLVGFSVGAILALLISLVRPVPMK